jgi:hypothetical protein
MASEEFEYEDTDYQEYDDSNYEVEDDSDDSDYEVQEDAILELPDPNEIEDDFGNPSLAELYEVLPKSLHGLIEPVVNKWQQGIDQEFESIAPYRRFMDAGIDPDIIGASLELAQQISTNPKAIYDELAERYGWRQAEEMMKQAVNVSNVVKEAEEDDFLVDPDMEQDPVNAEVAALRAEMEALREERNAEIEAATEANFEYEIGTSMEVLAEEYGEFDQEAVLRRAMILADEYPEAEIPQLIGAAFEQYNGELDRMRAQVGATRRAPRVAGGSGNSSLPAPEPVVYKTKEDRIAAIEAIAKQFINN